MYIIKANISKAVKSGNINENMNEYKDLISIMASAPKVPAPDGFTQSVMRRLPAEERLNIWQLLRQTLTEAGEISWGNSTREYAQGRNAFFYFLIAGLFLLIIGSVLFSSVFFIAYTFRAMGFILMQSILVLTAAIMLIAAGMMMAANIQGTAYWAKRAIMVYGILMIADAVLINAAVKTTLGGVVALAFGMAGIVTGTILIKALEKTTQENKGTFTGGLHNA